MTYSNLYVQEKYNCTTVTCSYYCYKFSNEDL